MSKINEQQKRKEESEKILKKLGSEFLPSLPLIETESETKIRTANEIGYRIICLVSVAAAADGVNKNRITDWLKNENAYDKLSKLEKAFLEKNETTQKEKNKFLWQSECIWLLLWSINKVKRNIPIEQCSIPGIIKIIPEFGTPIQTFINSIKVRRKNEIVDMSDFLYRAHWTTRQNQQDNTTNIGKLNPDVVFEWHYAINWLTCYEEIEDWDEITTDT